MKNISIIITLAVLILTMVSCSSGKNNIGCGYTESKNTSQDCRKNNTIYTKKEITTIDCAT